MSPTPAAMLAPGRVRTGTVDVWYATLAQSPTTAAALASVCAPDEHARAAHLRIPRRREEFLTGRGLVRQALARHLGGSPAAMALTTDATGKPRLATGDVSFNVAHSGGLIVVAVTSGGRVGIDLEHVRPGLDVDVVARRFFSEVEHRMLAALAPEPQATAFLRAWTRKEAVLKAQGCGLRTPIADVSVPIGAGPAPGWVVDGTWFCSDLALPRGYVGAIVTDFPHPSVVLRPLEPYQAPVVVDPA